MSVEIEVPENFKKVAKRKPASMQAAIEKCLRLLASNPRHPSLHFKPVQGTKDVWEIRIDNGNRITCTRDGDRVVLLNNCNHDILRRT